MPTTPHRYRSYEEDSARWIDFPFREGDIVISTRSKSGTTWMQRICLSLVLGTAELPGPLSRLSPWMDWLVDPRDEVIARLESQRHRRVIKTHTPLDGVPLDPRVKYIVVGRHPLDAAISLYHQSGNIDHRRVGELTGSPTRPRGPRPEPRDWLLSWIETASDPRESLDSLPGFVWHASDAWARRGADNVLLTHYAELSADLEGRMRGIADWLGAEIPESAWPSLVEGAGFGSMRSAHERFVPTPDGVLREPAEFFRGGRCGDGAALLSPGELADYHAAIAGLADPEPLRWLHNGGAQ